MTGLLRTAITVALPHGGQRRSRANALAALEVARVATTERAEAAKAFEPEHRVAVSR